MNDILKLVSTFVDATALMMALVLMVSIVHRSRKKSFKYTVLMGAVFSLAVLFTMSDPITLDRGGIFDMRGLLIGSGAALFGPVVGVMAMVAGLVMRWHIGGMGMVPGFVGMIVACGAGLLWRMTFRHRDIATLKKSIALGVMISFQMLAIFFTPTDLWITLFVSLVPYTLISNILGVSLINHLISGELSFLSETEALKVEANTDHLTGLLNRRGLDMIYPSLAENRDATTGCALLYFDLDNFKAINDTHGHAVGDDVLKSVTDQIARNLRPDDIFARLGGDEFAIILNRTDALEAQHVAERCRLVVSENGLVHDGAQLPITISVGGVWMLEHSEIDRILDQADKALYAAKSSGRNQVVFNFNLPRKPAPVVLLAG